MDRTGGTLLGGRVVYTQLAAGYRTGIEPVLMAAAVPAKAGDTVLEGGCGAGAALLCLLHRLPGVRGLGIELDADMAALARDNVRANGADAEIMEADVMDLAALPAKVDHAMANPPWRDPASTPSPDPKRRLALQGHGPDWIAPLAASLTPRGTLTLIVPARACAAAMAALHGAGLGRIVLCPLWPRQGAEAGIVLLQARRGVLASRVVAGLTLHGAGAAFTPEADAILRGGAALGLPG